MGGKNEIIRTDAMNALSMNGSVYVDSAKAGINSIEQIITELRELSLIGEKGLACRQVLNSISALTNDLLRTTEKIAVFMEAKINTINSVKIQEGQRTLVKQKDIYLNIKK